MKTQKAMPNLIEGQGDLIRRLIIGKIRVTIGEIGVISLLTTFRPVKSFCQGLRL